jgi:hypothetical protein
MGGDPNYLLPFLGYKEISKLPLAWRQEEPEGSLSSQRVKYYHDVCV